MPVDLSIRGMPDELAEALRRRAAEHHQSVDNEVLEILKASIETKRRLLPSEFVAQVRALGIRTPSEAAAMIREDRDAGHRG
jgi:plasmid stability protein